MNLISERLRASTSSLASNVRSSTSSVRSNRASTSKVAPIIIDRIGDISLECFVQYVLQDCSMCVMKESCIDEIKDSVIYNRYKGLKSMMKYINAK